MEKKVEGETLHASRFTLHSTRCTLHATRYALHATHYTLHATRYTVHITSYLLHDASYTHNAKCLRTNDQKKDLDAKSKNNQDTPTNIRSK